LPLLSKAEKASKDLRYTGKAASCFHRDSELRTRQLFSASD
jgi:hypothetical protein